MPAITRLLMFMAFLLYFSHEYDLIYDIGADIAAILYSLVIFTCV